MKIKLCVALSIGLMTTACTSNKPVLPREAITSTKAVTLQNNNHINLVYATTINSNQYNSQTILNIVSRSDTSKAVGLTVLQFGAQMLAGGGAISSFSKEDLRGHNIESVKNPYMDDIEPLLTEYVNSLPLKDSTTSHDIKIIPGNFKLMYDGLDSEAYNFIYSVKIIFNAGGKGYAMGTCNAKELTSADYQRLYSQWEKNNFELAAKVAQKIISNCFEKFKTEKYKTQITKAMNNELDKPVYNFELNSKAPL